MLRSFTAELIAAVNFSFVIYLSQESKLTTLYFLSFEVFFLKLYKLYFNYLKLLCLPKDRLETVNKSSPFFLCNLLKNIENSTLVLIFSSM